MRKYLIALEQHMHRADGKAVGLIMGQGFKGVPTHSVCVFDVSDSELGTSPLEGSPFVLAQTVGAVEFVGSFLDMLIDFAQRARTDLGAATLVENAVNGAWQDLTERRDVKQLIISMVDRLTAEGPHNDGAR